VARVIPGTPQAAEAERGGLTAQQYAQIRARNDALPGLERRINEIEALYRQHFEGDRGAILGVGGGVNLAGRILPNVLRPENEQFSSAADSLIGDLATMQGMTGGEMNSLAELRARFGPMLPQPGDSDVTIEQKIASLRAIVADQRRINAAQLGLPAPEDRRLPGGPAQGGLARGQVAPYDPTNPERPYDPNVIDLGPVGEGYDPQTGQALPYQPAVEGRGPNADPRAAMLSDAIANASPVTSIIHNAGNLVAGRDSTSAFERGIADVGTVGTLDEITAGTQSALGQGSYADNVARERAINAYDNENHFAARLGGQILGGFAMPLGRANSLRSMSAFGAGVGGAYGFGSGEGDVLERAPNALLGATIGAVAPVAIRGVGAGVRAVRGQGRPTVTAQGREVAQAAQEEGITISSPIAEPALRPRMGNLEAQVGSTGPVRESLSATARGIEERASQLVPGGNAAERGVMGQRIQGAVDRAHTRSGTAAGRVYDRAAAAEAAAGSPGIHASEAVRVLDENIARLERNPRNNASMIDYLRTVRSDFVDDAGNVIPKSIADIRDIRTSLSGEINRRTLSHTPAERIVNEAITAANADIARDLGAAAPEALRLYSRADRMWRARAENRRQVIERLIGPDDNRISGGDVLNRVQAMGRADAPRLRRLWSMLDPQERLDTAATVASAAGRRAPDEAFSPAQFIAWARSIPPRSREIMFGPEGARSISNLNRLSRELIDTRALLNNTGSGRVINFRAAMRDFFGGGIPGAAVGLLSGTGMAATGGAGLAIGAAVSSAGMLMRNWSARTLMSPDMTRWLAAAPTVSTSAAVRSHIARLTTVAARDPAVAQDALGLQRALLSAMNDNAANVSTRAAASGPAGGNNREEQNPRR
jgi:hypothetical protein